MLIKHKYKVPKVSFMLATDCEGAGQEESEWRVGEEEEKIGGNIKKNTRLQRNSKQCQTCYLSLQ